MEADTPLARATNQSRAAIVPTKTRDELFARGAKWLTIERSKISQQSGARLIELRAVVKLRKAHLSFTGSSSFA